MASKVQFKNRKSTEAIFVHCSATRPEQDVGVREIRQWHKQLGWLDVGYHFIIKRDGTVEEGRPIEAVGSHVKGWNEKSIGICLVGGVDSKMQPDANFTKEQMESLKHMLETLKQTLYPNIIFKAHHDVAPKACPSFNLSHWLETGELITSTKG